MSTYAWNMLEDLSTRLHLRLILLRSKHLLKHLKRRYYLLKRNMRSYCMLLLLHLLHSYIYRVYRITNSRFNELITSRNVFFSSFTWSSMIFTSCFMRNHSKRAWISYKRECFLRCLIKLVSSTILNSLHWHSQSINETQLLKTFTNLLRFRHHNQLELYSIESQKLLILRSMKLQTWKLNEDSKFLNLSSSHQRLLLQLYQFVNQSKILNKTQMFQIRSFCNRLHFAQLCDSIDQSTRWRRLRNRVFFARWFALSSSNWFFIV